jgi:ketosteroid isomerase-like protein
MSAQNLELVRAVFEAFNRRDIDGVLGLWHDSISWRTLFSVETDVLRGKQEIRAAWERQIEALDVHIEVVELTPLDETRVLAVGKWRGRGSESGAPVEQTAVQVFTVEDGRLRSVETYASRDEALEAAGLSDEDAHWRTSPS